MRSGDHGDHKTGPIHSLQPSGSKTCLRSRVKCAVYASNLRYTLSVIYRSVVVLVLALAEELKLSLSTPLTHRGVIEANLHSFLTSAVHENQGSNSSCGR